MQDFRDDDFLSDTSKISFRLRSDVRIARSYVRFFDLGENENNTSYRTLAEGYKILIGSVSNTSKRKAEYVESYEKNENSTKKYVQ